MKTIKQNLPGILICLLIAVPSWLIGKKFPVIGGPVIAIIIGMLLALVWTPSGNLKTGITFTSKKVLQLAVILLGFGLNLNVVLRTGSQSLPIIICTISTSLLIAFLLHKAMPSASTPLPVNPLEFFVHIMVHPCLSDHYYSSSLRDISKKMPQSIY